jgi:hypothetical protein
MQFIFYESAGFGGRSLISEGDDPGSTDNRVGLSPLACTSSGPESRYGHSVDERLPATAASGAVPVLWGSAPQVVMASLENQNIKLSRRLSDFTALW